MLTRWLFPSLGGSITLVQGSVPSSIILKWLPNLFSFLILKTDKTPTLQGCVSVCCEKVRSLCVLHLRIKNIHSQCHSIPVPIPSIATFDKPFSLSRIFIYSTNIIVKRPCV